MSDDIREVLESPTQQGTREKVPYYVSTVPWAGEAVPYGVSCQVFDVSNNGEVDVTDEILPVNTPQVISTGILTSKLQGMTLGHLYKLALVFSAILVFGDEESEATFDAFCLIEAT